MNQDKLIIVERPDPDLVIISQGIEGRRGPIGPRGFNGVGIKGDKGDKGDSAKELQIEVSGSSSIMIGSEQHGIQYVTTNTAAEVITVVLNECTVFDEENNVVDHKGTVVLFTQGTDVPVVFTTVEGVEVIPPKDTLPQVYGIGCSVGVIARDRYTWILVGDLAMREVILNEPDFISSGKIILRYDVTSTGQDYMDFELSSEFDTSGVSGELLFEISDGRSFTFNNGTYLEIYDLVGTGTITISGSFTNTTGKTVIMENYSASPVVEIVDFGEIEGLHGFRFRTSPSLIDAPPVLSPYFTNLSYMFVNAHNFNGKIGSWDTSNITNMDFMLFNNYQFNQNLTCWKVEQIPSAPNEFNTNGIISNMPLWGQANNDPTGRTGVSCQ